jgi:CheY-like chemotaxis protein
MNERIRVLIVEDNREARRSLRLLLEGWGCEVEEADDGLDGIGRAAARRPDAAVVDLDLPIYDGFGVARRLRQAYGEQVRLVALSGRDQPELALEAGFDEHLLKPAEPEQLRRALRTDRGGRRRSSGSDAA